MSIQALRCLILHDFRARASPDRHPCSSNIEKRLVVGNENAWLQKSLYYIYGEHSAFCDGHNIPRKFRDCCPGGMTEKHATYCVSRCFTRMTMPVRISTLNAFSTVFGSVLERPASRALDQDSAPQLRQSGSESRHLSRAAWESCTRTRELVRCATSQPVPLIIAPGSPHSMRLLPSIDVERGEDHRDRVKVGHTCCVNAQEYSACGYGLQLDMCSVSVDGRLTRKG